MNPTRRGRERPRESAEDVIISLLVQRGKPRRLLEAEVIALRHQVKVLRRHADRVEFSDVDRTFSYVDHYAFWRIVGWLRKRHPRLNMHTLVRRHLPGWEISDAGIEMFRPNRVAIERYRYRGTKIPTPWSNETTGPPATAA